MYPFGQHLHRTIGVGQPARIPTGASWASVALMLAQVAYPDVSDEYLGSIQPELIHVYLMPDGENIDDPGA